MTTKTTTAAGDRWHLTPRGRPVPTNVILLTGSRAFQEHPRATAWARELIQRVVMDAHPCDLVKGDAVGIDDLGDEVDVFGWTSRWCLNGKVMYRLLTEWYHEADWHTDSLPKRGDRVAWKALCLARDEAMVKHTARRLDKDKVECLAIVVPPAWRKTHGTEYTARKAVEAGIPLVGGKIHECPVELMEKSR